jgi:hypothetical protein
MSEPEYRAGRRIRVRGLSLSADPRDAAHARLAACDAWVGWIRHGV